MNIKLLPTHLYKISKRFLKMNQEDKYFDNLDSYDEYYKYVELKKKDTKVVKKIY